MGVLIREVLYQLPFRPKREIQPQDDPMLSWRYLIFPFG